VPERPDLRAEWPADVVQHTHRRGRIYRQHVTREAIEEGYDGCPITSVPAGDVEGAVIDHVGKLFAAPELVARTWATAKRADDDDVAEREVTTLLADFASAGPTCSRPSGRDRAVADRAG
jgi:hypothetical protein